MEIDAGRVKELRNLTGAPMLDCREALRAGGNDIEKAVVYLREKGIALAQKKMSRATKEGKIVSYIHPGDKIGVLIEINCETDFVAKSPEFVTFTKDLAMHIAAASPRYLKREDVPPEVLEQEHQILKTQAHNLNKPEKVIEKIIEGRLEKFYSEVCFLEQPFVKDDKMTIQDVIKGVIAKFGENVSINRFCRFQLGESN
ncbi:MAG: translation elongation factor Ts [Proteobacteria bacterium]|nr:translation elongation factor Ts [Pseudomonadota bacterium]